MENANETFDRFFGEHGIEGQDEEKFFATNFPDRTKDYYRVLGVPKSASFDDIKNAYRKLAIQYHPKNNPNDDSFNKKFIEVNEAFNALSDELRRRTYDDIVFGQISPFKAHSMFDNFFGTRWPDWS